MKKFLIIVISVLIFTSCNNNSGNKVSTDENKKDSIAKAAVVKPEILNEIIFRQKVFDYESNNEWKFLGNKPCIIDFYAEWCAPCRKLSPILEELANEFKGKIIFYKLNTDNNPNVSRYFKVTNIPAVLLCPMKGKPQMMVGLYPKEEYVNAIQDVLLKTVDDKQLK